MVASEKNILPYNGEAFYHPSFIENEQSDRYFNALLKEVHWAQHPIRIFGKEIMQPRLTAWFGDNRKSYTYSGLTMQAFEWTDTLLAIKNKIEIKLEHKFNSALLNLYRDGNDSMGWHRDNEKSLGTHPAIASVSFGATRKFQLRDYNTKDQLISVDLMHGSLLLMRGTTQPNWEHRVPKTKLPVGQRINITFRLVH